MIDFSLIDTINPYVRMMRLKRSAAMSGKWKDIDNVFTYIAAGSADFIVEGVKYTLKPGDLIIIPPYKTHVVISQGKDSLVQYIMHFDYYEEKARTKLVHKDILEDESDSGNLSEKEKELSQDVLIAEIPEAERNNLARRYLSLLREFRDNRPGRELMIRADCIGLLILAFRNTREAMPEKAEDNEQRTKSWLLIERAVEYINRQGIVNAPDNQAIAHAAGVTPNYLTRVFQEYLGISLHKYVMNLKVEKAQQLLLSGRVNVTEAARMAGFSSIHVLSKTFKNYLGISPSEFLDQSVNREGLVDNLYQEPGCEKE